MLHRLFLPRKQFYNAKNKLYKTIQNKRQMGKSEFWSEVRSSRKEMEKKRVVIFPENGVTKVLR